MNLLNISWKHICVITIAVTSIPILINLIMSLSTPLTYNATNNNQWLGFWGNYVGGIVAGFVAYFIATSQVKAENEKERIQEIQKYRSYIVLEEFIAPIDLNRVRTHPNSKILNNYEYEILRSAHGNGIHIPFFKIHYAGISEMILDCHIRINLRGNRSNGSSQEYEINEHMSVIENGIEIFIPISSAEYESVDPLYLEIEYKTMKNELMKFQYINDDSPMEIHYIGEIDKNNTIQYNRLLEIELSGVNWIYPSKLRN